MLSPSQVLSDINQTFYFGSEMRQFLPEALILSSLLSHPCRLKDHPHSHKLGSTKHAIPHFYIIPVLWRAISLSSRPAFLRARAESLMSSVVAALPFLHDTEHHVLLHTSTAAVSDLWGKHATLLIDPRFIVLHLEGERGDLRPGK